MPKMICCMNFITNHDENSWAGTEYERMGKYVHGFAAITYLMPGIPMIYTGQEAGLNKRLRFFEKDTISWADTSLYSTYRKLNTLKERNPALRAGIAAGKLIFQSDSVNHSVVLLRTSGENKVLGLFNFSDKPVSMKVSLEEAFGKYWDVFTGDAYKLHKKTEVQLDPYEYLVLEQQ